MLLAEQAATVDPTTWWRVRRDPGWFLLTHPHTDDEEEEQVCSGKPSGDSQRARPHARTQAHRKNRRKFTFYYHRRVVEGLKREVHACKPENQIRAHAKHQRDVLCAIGENGIPTEASLSFFGFFSCIFLTFSIGLFSINIVFLFCFTIFPCWFRCFGV